MWRSRAIALRRARSLHTNKAATGFSISKFPSVQSEVTLAPSYQSPSQILTSVVLFQRNPIIFFSSDSNTDSNDSNNTVLDDENENPNNFNFGEAWNFGVEEVNTALEVDVSDAENRESVQVVNEETDEVDVTQLESVLSLLKGKDGNSDDVSQSIETELDGMDFNLTEDFMVKVLENDVVSRKNLVVFFKWAAGDKNREVFSVTTRLLDMLVRAVCGDELKWKAAHALWDLIKELGEKEKGVVTTEMLNELISWFRRLGDGEAGYEVFSKFDDFLCVKNADSYYYTIEALCRSSIFFRVGSVSEEMVSEEKLPDVRKFGNIISCLCKAGLVKEAHSLYLSAKEKEELPPQSSINLLISSLCDRKKRDAESVHLALKMLEDFSGREQKKYAIKQFSSVIQGLCGIHDLNEAKVLLFKMIDDGPPPGNAVFNMIINALSKAGDVAEAIKMMRVMEGRGLKPDVFAYSVIMSAYAKSGEIEEAARILAEAKKKHHKLTPVAYHTIIRGYCRKEQFTKALDLLHEMEKYGVKPNTDEYNKLIQSLCLKAADWGTAEKLMEQMKQKGLHLNGITKALVRAVKELEEEAMETKEVCVGA